MVRTQVYLTPEIVSGIKRVAKRTRQRPARVIRDLLADALSRAQADEEPVAKLIGRYHSGHQDTSRCVDEILYGK